MTKFKEGDRVVVNKTCNNVEIRGWVGTVKAITPTIGMVAVHLDGEGHNRGFSATMLDPVAAKANNLTDKQVRVYNAMMALNEAKNELRLAIEDMDE